MKASSRAAPALGRAIVAACGSLMRDLFGTYRPERHYMRGPGPKWRAKHRARRSVESTAPVAAVAARDLVEAGV